MCAGFIALSDMTIFPLGLSRPFLTANANIKKVCFILFSFRTLI
jgi:hypothetical protein